MSEGSRKPKHNRTELVTTRSELSDLLVGHTQAGKFFMDPEAARFVPASSIDVEAADAIYQAQKRYAELFNGIVARSARPSSGDDGWIIASSKGTLTVPPKDPATMIREYALKMARDPKMVRAFFAQVNSKVEAG